MDDAVVEFASVPGLWSYLNQETWVPLHPFSPTRIAAGDLDGNGVSDLGIDFGSGIGIYVLRTARPGHHCIHPRAKGCCWPMSTATGLTRSSSTSAGLGLWAYVNDSVWVLVHGLSPETMAAGRLH